MSLVNIIILAVVLGIDCLVVSFSQGLIFKKNRMRNSLLLALSMGFFQGFMPILSYCGVDFIEHYIEPYENIIIFSIFLCLGAKFIAGAFFEKDEKLCLDLNCIIIMGIATSIDALAAGVVLKLMTSPLLLSVFIIGIVSFVMSVSGFWLGNFFKKLPSKALEISGGLILILLAIKGLP